MYVLVKQTGILSHEASCTGERGFEPMSSWLACILGDYFFLLLRRWQVSLMDPPSSA